MNLICSLIMHPNIKIRIGSIVCLLVSLFVFLPPSVWTKEGNSLSVLKSEHFILKFLPQDSSVALLALPNLEDAWLFVDSLFCGNVPEKIDVKIERKSGASPHNPIDNSFSLGFHPDNLYAKQYPKKFVREIAAHEITHFALFRISKGASTVETFQFLNEGLASIVGNAFISNNENYKINSFSAGHYFHLAKKTGLEQIMDWCKYFRSSYDWRAYFVASSLVYLFLDKYGFGHMFYGDVPFKELLIDRLFREWKIIPKQKAKRILRLRSRII